MTKSWLDDNCEQIKSYYAYYSIPQAALLWCGLSFNEVERELVNIQPSNNTRGVYIHRHIPCLEPRCRALHDAIDNGELPCSRENGKTVSDHVSPERRHVKREDLKNWIAENFPNDKPSFLFDEVEQGIHPRVTIDTYRELKAEYDLKSRRVTSLLEDIKALNAKMDALAGERDSLKAMIDNCYNRVDDPVNQRLETSYLNIIAVLLELMLSKSPSGKNQSVFDSQKSIIEAALAYHEGKPGISTRTMQEKFAAANKSLFSC